MKRFRIIFSQVISVLYAFKVRTAIAIIGVLLGAFALVTVQNLSLALKDKVAEDIKTVGDRVITIFARAPRIPGVMVRRGRIKTMKYTDVYSILTVNNVVDAAPVIRGSKNEKYLNNAVTTAVIGSNNKYFDFRGLTVENGRVFEPDEIEAKERVAVIGSDVANELFGNTFPVGKIIFLGDMTFQVLGVLNSKGSDATGNNLDNVVIIPVTTAETRLFKQTYLNEIIVRIRDWGDYEIISKDITSVLRINHNLSRRDTPDDFNIINPIEEEELSNTLVKVASILGSASAGIAFFIGSVGIFSLMLLTVNQRITEIGIRRAIGATKSDILYQFLFESGYIGIMGGLMGVALGSILSLMVSHFAKLPYSISFIGIFIGLTASILSGVFAGLYPAIRASRVVPVKALNM
jgi:putative ABC transport system permease protein